MKLPSWSLKWKDALTAISITLIGQALLIVTQAADATFPTLEEFKIGLIGSIKYAVIPYLIKTFFTNDIKAAQNTLANAKIEGLEAAEKIPPVIDEPKTD